MREQKTNIHWEHKSMLDLQMIGVYEEDFGHKYLDFNHRRYCDLGCIRGKFHVGCDCTGSNVHIQLHPANVV
jgi:hypothetical protein